MSGAASRLLLLGSLYLSQGLPYGFFTQALPVMLRQRGHSLADIGLTSLLALPWALKFLWAPLVDRLHLPGVGRRRSWILPLQAASALLLAALAFAPPAGATRALLAAVLLANLLAATQDVATDGLAVEVLRPEERGLANGVQVGGYRVGMIIGGGAILILLDRLGWSGAFLAMAGLLAAATVPVLLHREAPPAPRAAPREGPPGTHLLRRPGGARFLLVLATYKLGEAMASSMLRPMLTDAGLGLADLGLVVGTVGFAASLAGALLGGALTTRLGRRRALLAFGVAQSLSILLVAALAAHLAGGGAPVRAWVLAVSAAEHLATGMATVALFTAMMDRCAPGSEGADYTVQASAVVIATGAASAASGFLAERLGYPLHFTAAAGLSLAALLVVGAAVEPRAPGDRP